jgi:hypothetical protein
MGVAVCMVCSHESQYPAIRDMSKVILQGYYGYFAIRDMSKVIPQGYYGYSSGLFLSGIPQGY